MSGLQRARTMPTQRSAPMGTAVRRSGAAAKAKGSRAATLGAKRKAAVKSKNAKQAYDAATMAVMDMREEKWFDVSGDIMNFPEAPTEGPKRVSVMAFSTTSNLEPGTAIAETYCGRAIKNLNMLKPFKQNAADDKAPYAIEGKHVFPTLNSVSWQINRLFAMVGPTFNPSSPRTKAMSGLVNALAVRCRLIRVTPKLAPGITTAISPTTDLFLDQHGLPYSPSDSQFSYSDAEFASVNRRKYTVLQDTKFTITQPLNQQYVPSSSNQAELVPCPGTQGPHTKKLVTRHQLTAKKGGAVYYEQPDAPATVNATTGHRREYVFMHFWYENADGGGVTGTLPQLDGTGIVPDMDTIKVHWRTESRFKEA